MNERKREGWCVYVYERRKREKCSVHNPKTIRQREGVCVCMQRQTAAIIYIKAHTQNPQQPTQIHNPYPSPRTPSQFRSIRNSISYPPVYPFIHSSSRISEKQTHVPCSIDPSQHTISLASSALGKVYEACIENPNTLTPRVIPHTLTVPTSDFNHSMSKLVKQIVAQRLNYTVVM